MTGEWNFGDDVSGAGSAASPLVETPPRPPSFRVDLSSAAPAEPASLESSVPSATPEETPRPENREFLENMIFAAELAEGEDEAISPLRLSVAAETALLSRGKLLDEEIDVLKSSPVEGAIPKGARALLERQKGEAVAKAERLNDAIHAIDIGRLESELLRTNEESTRAQQLAEEARLEAEIKKSRLEERRTLYRKMKTTINERARNGKLSEEAASEELASLGIRYEELLAADNEALRVAKERQTEAEERKRKADVALEQSEVAKGDVRRLDEEKRAAQELFSQVQESLNTSDVVMREQNVRLAEMYTEKREVKDHLSAHNIGSDVSALAEALRGLKLDSLEDGSVDIMVLDALRADSSGEGIDQKGLLLSLSDEVGDDKSVRELREILSTRIDRVKRLLAIENASSPKEKVEALKADAIWEKLPHSFRAAIGATMDGRPFLRPLSKEHNDIYRGAVDRQREIYTKVLIVWGLKPFTAEAMVERTKSGEVILEVAREYAKIAKFGEGEAPEVPEDLRDVPPFTNAEEFETWRNKVWGWARESLQEQVIKSRVEPASAASKEEGIKDYAIAFAERRTGKIVPDEIKDGGVEKIEEWLGDEEGEEIGRKLSDAIALARSQGRADVKSEIEVEARRVQEERADKVGYLSENLDKNISRWESLTDYSQQLESEGYIIERLRELQDLDPTLAAEQGLRFLGKLVGGLDGKQQEQVRKHIEEMAKSGPDKVIDQLLTVRNMGISRRLEPGGNPDREKILRAVFAEVLKDSREKAKSAATDRERTFAKAALSEIGRVVDKAKPAGFVGLGLISILSLIIGNEILKSIPSR